MKEREDKSPTAYAYAHAKVAVKLRISQMLSKYKQGSPLLSPAMVLY